MADNTKQSADDTIATDEIASGVAAGAKVQRLKTGFGTNGSYGDVEASNPLPVQDAAVLAVLEAIEALASTIDADTGGMLTSLQLLDNAIAGSEMQVDVVGALPAGTNAIGKLAANSGVDIGDVDVTSLTGGTVAHDAADSGNPIKVGGRARSDLSLPVATGDRTDLATDAWGRVLVATAPGGQRVSATLNRTDTTSGQLLGALAEGLYVITAVMVSNSHATVGTKVEILDGESVKWKGYAGPLGGGFAVAEHDGLFSGSKATKLNGKCATTGADVDISVSGYKISA